MKNKEESIQHIGTLLKNSPKLHDIEYQLGFNLHSITFFQRLISKDLIDKGVRIESDNFYKGLIFLDYFCKIVEDYYGACDVLVDLSKAWRSEEKKVGKIYDGTASYLNLESVVETIGLCAKQRGNKYYSTKKNIDEIRKRYDQNKKISGCNFKSAKRVDPYYEAIGLMIYDLVDDKMKEYLGEAESKTDVEAIIFTDCISNVIEDKDYKIKIKDSLNKQEYFEASLLSIEGLVKEASNKKVESFMVGGKNA